MLHSQELIAPGASLEVFALYKLHLVVHFEIINHFFILTSEILIDVELIYQVTRKIKVLIKLKQLKMETNENLRDAIFDIIKNQMKANDPAEVKLTYKRMLALGYNDFVAKQLIGQCLSVELFDVLKMGKEFDLDRYVKNLKKLPEEPFED